MYILSVSGAFSSNVVRAFFNFDKKKVDVDAFRAINKACLVFDGKLVIDSTFHTNDITIRAAGSLTKYSRRYFADQWSHANFNSKEIGFQLAALMLHLFDPTLEQVTKPPAELDKLLPTYTGCKAIGSKHESNPRKASISVHTVILELISKYEFCQKSARVNFDEFLC
eukprot:g43406.t1